MLDIWIFPGVLYIYRDNPIDFVLYSNSLVCYTNLFLIINQPGRLRSLKVTTPSLQVKNKLGPAAAPGPGAQTGEHGEPELTRAEPCRSRTRQADPSWNWPALACGVANTERQKL